YGYDNTNRRLTAMTVLSGAATVAYSSYTYDAQGNPSQTFKVDNTTSGYVLESYSPTNRRTALNVIDEHAVTVQSSTTSYLPSGLVEETFDGNATDSHTYDAAGRETSSVRSGAVGTSAVNSYSYDNASRRTTDIDSNNNTTSYSYDADGNITL